MGNGSLMGTAMFWLYWSQWWQCSQLTVAEFEVETRYSCPKWTQVMLFLVTIAVHPNSRFLRGFRWDTLVLFASKFRTLMSHKFITSFKIRAKRKEQEHLQNSSCCYVLLACFSFLCSFFPPRSTPHPPTIYWFCSTRSVLLWVL